MSALTSCSTTNKRQGNYRGGQIAHFSEKPEINKDGERVKIRVRHLPTKRPKVGVDYSNIWDTPTGEVFLNEYGIELKVGENESK